MYNFLLIEDNDSDVESFLDSVNRINLAEEAQKYRLKIAKSYEEGLKSISEALNGIIVDIKLGGEHSGDEIVHEVTEKYRVPVVIFTGTPDIHQEPGSPIHVYIKGEASHEVILEDLSAASDTGLYNVLGGTGILEQVMTKVFWTYLYPKIDIWKEKKKAGVDTEKVLLRYAISHIHELIDKDMPKYITEEMYICPPISPQIATGSIVRNKEDGTYGVVLSPPCDLEIRESGRINTDSILVCMIESQDQVHSRLSVQNEKNKSAKEIESAKKIRPAKEIKNSVEKAVKNNHTDYYHWLPCNALFEGGYINFRKVNSYSPENLNKVFDPPTIKIQEGFVKDILGRFSRYYARQGQPEFDDSKEIANAKENAIASAARIAEAWAFNAAL